MKTGAKKPETEWAGMTDRVKAVKESEDDGEEMSQGQEAKDRVGRNDRLSQGSREGER